VHIDEVKKMMGRLIRKTINRFIHFGRGLFFYLRPPRIREGTFRGFIPPMRFFFHPKDRERYVQALQEFYLTDEIIAAANKICNHVFDMLGSGDVYLGPSINWHQDFKSGYIWPQRYRKWIKTVDLSRGADVKVPWELSRFQHLAVLGQAYWLSEDEKYPREFTAQIEDWIKHNPVEIGVNWTCTMDVAIRAVNWIIGYYYFHGSPEISADFWDKFLSVLFLKGRFVLRNLERNPQGHGNNHYLADLAGLVWLGLFFGTWDRETEKWLETGIRGLVEEMDYQVNPEGTDFEASIPYHRLVTEIFLSTTILAEKNGISFPGWYRERLERMCQFVLDYTKPDGMAPMIGDNDDGRFHIFTHYGVEEKRDHRHLLGVAGEYFDRDDFRSAAGAERMDGMWIWGSLKDFTEHPEPGPILRPYHQMGCYILRDEEIYVMIRCGGTFKKGMGGHSHNDQLSIVLNIRGRDILIDPGTYVYTADWRERNRFRGTGYHNTLQIADAEQNLLGTTKLFDVEDRTKAKVLKLGIGPGYVDFLGQHEGFRSQYGVIHTRRIFYCMNCKRLMIYDWLDKRMKRTVSFVFNDDCKLLSAGQGTFQTEDGILIRFMGGEVSLRESFLSKKYGEKVKTLKAEVSGEEDTATVISFHHQGGFSPIGKCQHIDIV